MERNKRQQRERAKKFGQLVARAWSDPEFKKRLMAEPNAVLEELGFEVPPGLQIKVVENTAKEVYGVLPHSPAEGEPEMDLGAGGISESLAQFGQLMAQVRSNPAFKRRLMADPNTVLEEMGLHVPPRLKVKVVQNSAKKVYFTLPPKPTDLDLSDEQLAEGTGVALWCCACRCCGGGTCGIGIIIALTFFGIEGDDAIHG